jgi:hypothetical protein
MQRDVEFEVDSIDKSGGFIGALYLNKSENVAISLVKEGLATIHSFSADSLSWARQLYEAEVKDSFFVLCHGQILNQHIQSEAKQAKRKVSLSCDRLFFRSSEVKVLDLEYIR